MDIFQTAQAAIPSDHVSYHYSEEVINDRD